MLIDIGLAHYKLFLRWGITRFSIQGVLDGEEIATTKGSLAFKLELFLLCLLSVFEPCNSVFHQTRICLVILHGNDFFFPPSIL